MQRQRTRSDYSQPTDNLKKTISLNKQGSMASITSEGAKSRKNQVQPTSAAAKRTYEKNMKHFNDIMDNRMVTNGEKMTEFIHRKKEMNPVKYTEKSRINNQALPVSKGTISMMLNVKKKEDEIAIPDFKSKVSKKSRFKIKWKTIQWLMDYKQEAIYRLCSNYDFLIKFINERGTSLTKEDFYELMSYIGLGAEKPVVEKLFFVLDEDSSGDIDYRELITGLEYFKDTGVDEKLKVFFDISDLENTGVVTKKAVYDVLKRNIISDLDKEKLKRTLTDIFFELDRKRIGYVKKEVAYKAALANPDLKMILEESIRAVKKVDKIIENDLEEPYQTWIPISGNMINFKEGIHFPISKNLMSMVKENENIKHSVEAMKKQFNEEYVKLKVTSGLDFDDDILQY